MTSILKVDTIQDQSGNNIINENADTITIGASGDTVTLAAGASQSGFGRTGTVNWDTTAKTANFTAVNGVGYFANTSGGAFTMSLPAGSAGAIVSVADYTNSFQTNALTITPNGSEKINGGAGAIDLNIEGQSLTLVYVDGTEGWKSVQDSTTSTVGSNFIIATGGTILTCGDFKTHVFTGPGTFTVTNAGSPLGSDTVEYLVVAGGAGGGLFNAGGGGAGGYRQNYPSPAIAGLPVTVTSFPITVGSGGAASTGSCIKGGNGNSSIFSTITSTGGGGGGSDPNGPISDGATGGSGGGSRGGTCGSGGSVSRPGGAGNTPPVSPSQGNPGGGGIDAFIHNTQGGGGGGAGAAGSDVSPLVQAPGPHNAGSGGIGSPIATTFFGPTAPSYGTPGPAPGRYFAGGGGGATNSGGSPGAGGAGGGGAGTGVSGTTNTGGGGGSKQSPAPASGAGGSGIVIIRYKYQ